MPRFLAALHILLWISTAQAADLSGIVLRSDGDPAAFAHVRLLRIEQGHHTTNPVVTLASDAGTWRFHDVEPGRYDLDARHIHGQAPTQTIDVRDSGSVDLSISLQLVAYPRALAWDAQLAPIGSDVVATLVSAESTLAGGQRFAVARIRNAGSIPWTACVQTVTRHHDDASTPRHPAAPIVLVGRGECDSVGVAPGDTAHVFGAAVEAGDLNTAWVYLSVAPPGTSDRTLFLISRPTQSWLSHSRLSTFEGECE